jgi:bifunctional ADP-heptose synthase (sugar kinase/adenylyltransferase)
VLKEVGAAIRLIPFEAGYSTSALLERICNKELAKTRSIK